MKIPIQKLKAILLFFGSNTDPRFLGKVKLMKLFYFIDFSHVRKYGAPITYDRYVHLEHGPIPSTIKNLVDEVEDDFDRAQLSDTIAIKNNKNGLQKRIVCNRKFEEKDKKYFSENEIEIIGEVCSRFFDANAKKIEDASHAEAPWSRTGFLEDIPYALAIGGGDSRSTKEEVEFLLKIVG